MQETLVDAMTRVKEQVNLAEYCDSRLERRGRNYVCPFCDSGNGPRRSAAFTVTGNRFKCFSCGEGGDVFDLAAHLDNAETKRAQLEAVAGWAGVSALLDEGHGMTTRTGGSAPAPAAHEYGGGDVRPDAPRAQVRPVDYSEGRSRHLRYVEAMRENIEHPDVVRYLSSRGIDLETAKAFGLGYDPTPAQGWQDAVGEWHKSGRLIIPFTGAEWYHVDRAIDDRAENAKYVKPRADEVGPQPIWNEDALSSPAFFVVEGALDAIAVKSCGFEAVALCGTGGRSLMEAVSGRAGVGTALLLLDNDETHEDGGRPGQDAQERLLKDMDAAGVDCVSLDASQIGAKDAAEALSIDGDALRSVLGVWYQNCLEDRERRKQERYARALNRLHVVNAAEISESIVSFESPVSPIPTGFRRLDKVLCGGLQPQNVYVIGGGTSVGKTSFVLQVADQIAASGTSHVLFCSIEQRAKELIAKSLSRTLACVPDSEGRLHYATAQDLTVYDRRMAWSENFENRLALESAQEHYRERVAPRMHFMEAQQQPTVADVRVVAQMMAERDGIPPVLMVDYLQLLGAPDGHEREDEKSTLKRNMVALRQLAGELETPVVVLAALSREGALKSMEADSFRDSSNIEYSSDVLLGLQLRNLKKRLAAVEEKQRKYLAGKWQDEERTKRIRELEIVVIKNRGGETVNGVDGGIPICFDAPLSNFASSFNLSS